MFILLTIQVDPFLNTVSLRDSFKVHSGSRFYKNLQKSTTAFWDFQAVRSYRPLFGLNNHHHFVIQRVKIPEYIFKFGSQIK